VCHFYDATDGGRVCRACRAARVVLPVARVSTLPGRTEAEIQAEVVAYLRLHGWAVWKTSAHRHAKGVDRGIPDLIAIRERLVFIECKEPVNGVVSAEQREFHAAARAAGIEVVIAYSIDDVAHLVAVPWVGLNGATAHAG
jgi:Holliday junction resolvase